MQKNVASQKLIVYAFDSTTNLPKTGDAANLTAYVSKDYGAVTVLGDTSATEMDSTNAKGYYLFDLTQAETNADTLLFSCKSSTANIVVIGVPATVFTTPPNFSLQSIDSNGRVDVIKLAGTTQTARDIGASVLLSSGTGTGQLDFTSGVVKANVTQYGGSNGTFASGRPEVNTTHIAGSAVSTSSAQIGVNVVNAGGTAWASGSLTSGVFASGAITATAIAADAIGASELAADAVAEIAETVCEYMHTFNTTYDYTNVVSGSAIFNWLTGMGKIDVSPYIIPDPNSVVSNILLGFVNYDVGATPIAFQSAAQYVCDGFLSATTTSTAVDDNSAAYWLLQGMFLKDTGTTYASSVAGSVVKETADNADGITVADIAAGMFTENTGLDYNNIATGSPFRGLLRGMIAYNTGLDYTSIGTGSVALATNEYMATTSPPSQWLIDIGETVCSYMFTFDTALTFASAVPGSVVYETATNSGGSNPWSVVIEAGYTAAEMLRLIAAESVGANTVAGSTEEFVGIDGTTTRVSGTVDAQGQRSAITYNGA